MSGAGSDKENRGSPQIPSSEDYSSDVDSNPGTNPPANASSNPGTSAAAATGNQTGGPDGSSTPPRSGFPILVQLLSPSKARIPSSLVSSQLQGVVGVRSEDSSLQVTEGSDVPESIRIARALSRSVEENVSIAVPFLFRLLSSPDKASMPSSSLVASELQEVGNEGASLQDTEAREVGVPEAVRISEAVPETVQDQESIGDVPEAVPIAEAVPETEQESRGGDVPEAVPIAEAVHQAVLGIEARGVEVAEDVSKAVKYTETKEEIVSEAGESAVSNIPEDKQCAAAEDGSVPEAMQVSEAHEGGVPEVVNDSVPDVEMYDATEINVPEAVQKSVPEVEMPDATGSNIPEVVPDSTAAKDSAPAKSEVADAATEEKRTSESKKDFKKPADIVPFSSGSTGSLTSGPFSSKMQTVKSRIRGMNLGSESPKRRSARIQELQKNHPGSPSPKKERISSSSERISSDERKATRGSRSSRLGSTSSNSEKEGSGDESEKGKRASRKDSKK